MEELDVRYSMIEDGKYLTKWLLDKENLKWFPPSEKEAKDYANNWIGFSRCKSSLTATLKGVPCGIITLYLMPYKKVAHLSMFYLIVDKQHRNKGIGTVLIKNMLNLAEKYFSLESVYAEVFDGCPIIPVLEKLEFSSFGAQPHFVKENGKYLGRIHYEYVFNKEKN